MSKKKIIVAHPGKQHSFQMATAVKEAGCLYKYITTVYYKKGNLTQFVTDHFLKGKDLNKAHTRTTDSLDDEDVLQINEFYGLITLAVSRISCLNKLYIRWNVWVASNFYKKVMKYAKKHSVDAVIVYDGISRKYFDVLSDTKIKKIVDVSFASRQFLKALFEDEINNYGITEMRTANPGFWDGKLMHNDMQTTMQADYFFAPSNFVCESLQYCGVERDRIGIVPYGVDLKQFCYIEKQFDPSNPLFLLYVGEISYRKGIHRLLEVVSKFDSKQVNLKLCGKYDKRSAIYQKFCKYPNIEFAGFITRDVLAKAYQEADAFVFPTLGEGFGLVVLEALACGLPVICSNRAGGNDSILEGKNGFVISMDTNEMLENRIKWCIENRQALYSMRETARESVLNYTWDNYGKNIATVLRGWLNETD